MITKKYVNDLSYKIVGAAIEVHKALGPGLMESVYEKCLKRELELMGFEVKAQHPVPIKYKGISVDCELRLDILVNDLIIIELKAVETMLPLFSAQILTYMKLLQKPKGLLINFNCENITSQLIPFVNSYFSALPDQ